MPSTFFKYFICYMYNKQKSKWRIELGSIARVDASMDVVLVILDAQKEAWFPMFPSQFAFKMNPSPKCACLLFEFVIIVWNYFVIQQEVVVVLVHFGKDVGQWFIDNVNDLFAFE